MGRMLYSTSPCAKKELSPRQTQPFGPQILPVLWTLTLPHLLSRSIDNSNYVLRGHDLNWYHPVFVITNHGG